MISGDIKVVVLRLDTFLHLSSLPNISTTAILFSTFSKAARIWDPINPTPPVIIIISLK